jgi:hypothetical protein
MVYTVKFADGTPAQITASSDGVARQLAVTKFREKIVLEVKRAGLLGMAQRPARKPVGHS